MLGVKTSPQTSFLLDYASRGLLEWVPYDPSFPTSIFFFSSLVLFLPYHYFLCKRHVHDYLMKTLLHVVSIATGTKRTSI